MDRYKIVLISLLEIILSALPDDEAAEGRDAFIGVTESKQIMHLWYILIGFWESLLVDTQYGMCTNILASPWLEQISDVAILCDVNRMTTKDDWKQALESGVKDVWVASPIVHAAISCFENNLEAVGVHSTEAIINLIDTHTEERIKLHIEKYGEQGVETVAQLARRQISRLLLKKLLQLLREPRHHAWIIHLN